MAELTFIGIVFRTDKVKTLEAKIRTLQDPTVVAFGDVNITTEQLNTIKMMSCNSKFYARNLMRIVFKDDELTGRTLFGRKFNGDKDRPVRPAIDPTKRDAILGRHSFLFILI
jgi:hypothetical protein